MRRLLLLAVLLPVGCRLNADTPKQRNDEINRALLERLGEDALTPVEDFDEESYFDELERLYTDAPPERVTPDPGPEEPGELNPYLELGASIWPVGEGMFVKPYSFPAGMGRSIRDLAVVYAEFPVIPVDAGAALPPTADQSPHAPVLDHGSMAIIEGDSFQRGTALDSAVGRYGDGWYVNEQPDHPVAGQAAVR